MKYGRPLPFLAYGIWDLTNGHIIKAEWQEVDSNHIMLSPDGRRVVSRDDNKATLRVFDFQTGKLLAILEGESAILERARFTPDGQRLIVGYSLYQSRYLPILRVWDLSTSECIAVYYGDHSVTGFSEINARGQFAYGTDSGKVFGVTLNEQEKHAPFVTPVRLWRLERGRRFWFGALQSSKNSGKWDDHLTVTCPWCGKRFPVKSGLTDVIQLISRDAGLGESHPPCLGLPYQAWDCPELRFECSNCERPLRSNPFVVDTRT
jgi:WD40 repeat protein